MSESSRDDALSFEEQEWQCVHERREKAFPGSQRAEGNPEPKHLVGLSLSGGGLRSAMFNDGFLQGLSHSGLLRYVDYLCSVSGGGYIAGHLATRAKKDSTTGFHDDESTEEGNPRWALGRDPVTGKVDSGRLAGVGRYLASKVAIAPSFLWSLLQSALVLFGITGIIATLLALFWRSFDDPMFRLLLHNVLDFHFGGELAIAFYPAIVVLVGWVFFCWLGWFAGSTRQMAVNRIGLSLFIGAVLVSFAVFIGNGKTSVTGGGSASLELNHYAQWIAIVAGVFQLFAFLGRDRLFRSERDESPYWRKAVQKISTSGVVVFAVFAMVHWMAREDISGYTQQRSTSLVRGDVADWDLLQRISAAYDAWKKEQPKLAPPANAPGAETDNVVAVPDIEPIGNINVAVDIRDSGVNMVDGWAQHQLAHPLIPMGPESMLKVDSSPPTPPVAGLDDAGAWTFWQRVGGAVLAYAYTRWTPNDHDFKYAELEFNDSPAKTIRQYQLLAYYRWQQQEEFLVKFNQKLESNQFTQFLLHIGESVDASDKDRIVAISTNRSVQKIQMPHLAMGDQQSSTYAGPNVAYRRKITTANRELLTTLFPNSIQGVAVPSTLVVPPYDQAARWRWLLGWWILLCFGVCLSLIRNQSSTIYTYYRKRLSRLFLHPNQDSGDAYQGTTPLHQLRPTRDGLPHPLFLGSRMTPCVVEGSYHVRNRPFVFSPIYCGDREQETFNTAEIGIPGVGKTHLMIGDAVTISGAAVTPLMTDARGLSLVLSLFGDGLGQWMIRRKSDLFSFEIAGLRSSPLMGPIVYFAGLAAAAIAWYHLGFSFSIFLILVISALAIIIAHKEQSGICQYLFSIFAPHDIGAKVNSQALLTSDRLSKSELSNSIGHVADGGFYDYLGVSELFRRKCRLIVVSDAGANLGNNPLGPLAKMCSDASSEFGIRILDLDHESPIDFGRLEVDRSNEGQRVVHQPYLVARLRYADNSEGLLVYCQMAITDSDPIEIQQIRNRFPSFPDEPTSNQFYTDDQVAAYRNLGHHIAARMCSELFRWSTKDVKDEIKTTLTQPYFRVVQDRLLTAYRLTCYQERNYKKDDLFSEAIWSSPSCTSLSFDRTVQRVLFGPAPTAFGDAETAYTRQWLCEYEGNADLRARYRHDVLKDINSTDDHLNSACARTWRSIMDLRKELGDVPKRFDRELMSAHLTAIAVACHEIHEGRPNAIFQVGGREKLIAMMAKLRDVLIDADPNETELQMLTSVQTPADESSLTAALKQCIGEIVELEKCTFQGCERVTTISFAQCLVMMWGELSRDQFVTVDGAAKSFDTIANRIREEGVELTASKVRIRLEHGLRDKQLSAVVRALENAWCITYLPSELIVPPEKKQPLKKPAATRKKTKSR